MAQKTLVTECQKHSTREWQLNRDRWNKSVERLTSILIHNQGNGCPISIDVQNDCGIQSVLNSESNLTCIATFDSGVRNDMHFGIHSRSEPY